MANSIELTWFFEHNELGRVRATGFFTPGCAPSREDDGYPAEYNDTRFYIEKQGEEDVTDVIDEEVDEHIERAGTSPLYDTIITAAVDAYKTECLIDELAEQELRELDAAIEQADAWIHEQTWVINEE